MVWDIISASGSKQTPGTVFTMQIARQMRRGITSAVLALTLLGLPVIAHALTCASRLFTLSEAYEVADSIIVGLVAECKDEVSSDPWASGGNSCSFTTLEVLKESMPARDYNGVASSSACGLSLHVGDRYLLFLDSENQPMWFSAPLGGDPQQVQVANSYLRILRDFRNGFINDLAEPWMFIESDHSCSISHGIGGNQIRFTRRTSDAPQQPRPEWNQEKVGDKPVYKATVPIFAANATAPSGDAEVVVFGNAPDYSDDALMLRVSLRERSPAPVRRVTLSVGNQTWSLNRMEMHLSLAGASAHTIVEYYVAGDIAEKILSAMAQPSDIALSATVIPSDTASEPPEIAASEQSSFVQAPTKDAYSGQAAPETNSTRPKSTSNVRAARSRRAQKESPDPVLRVESRSTQLPSVIERFHACHARKE